MTFDVYTGEAKEPAKMKVVNPEDRDRAEVIIHGLLNSPQGQELVRIWENQLINSPVFQGGSDIASLNVALGVNKCIQKFIQISRGPKTKPKPKIKETKE